MNLIVAVDNKWGIGKNNSIPWKIKEDMDFFLNLTTDVNNKSKKNAVIMGKNTWLSIPEKKKPLIYRYNIIVSSTLTQDNVRTKVSKYKQKFIFVFKTLKTAYDFCKTDINNDIENIFVIGGTQLYDESIKLNYINKLYITHINYDYKCDVFFPQDRFCNKIKECDNKVLIHNNEESVICKNINKEVVIKFNYYDLGIYIDEESIDSDESTEKVTIYSRNNDEFQYLNLLNRILIEDKIGRITRNGKTFSVFGGQLNFDIENNFPLLTTKKMYWRGIVEELLFFIKGDTNSKHLNEKKVKIWNPNTTRQFLDSVNLQHYSIGDMGPMYGWQWRYFGEKYKGMDHDYKGTGFDQLKNVIKLIKEDPNSRRILMTTYNPVQVNESVLAPCHSLVLQFYVRNGYLSCHMYQRSADFFLGVPFNIASTSLLLYIIANATNLKPKNVFISFGDIHIYENHIKQVKIQLDRNTFHFTKLIIKKKLNKNNSINDIINYMESLSINDFELKNYKCHPSIKAKMVA